MNDNMKFKFNGEVEFKDGKMVTTYNILDEDTTVSSFTNSIDCSLNEISDKSSSGLAKLFKANQQEEATFSSGIWSILLKDVLKTVGGVLIAQIKKKVEKKIKEKFKNSAEECTNEVAS